MNTELIKIRKNKDAVEEVTTESMKMDSEHCKQYYFNLNTNMANLYMLDRHKEATLDDYINAYANNICLVLDIFNEINVYPDYFYDVIFRANIDYQKFASSNSQYCEYELRRKFIPHINVPETIRKGLKNGYHRVKSSDNRNINDYFVELISYYQAFDLPYNDSSLENCSKVFEKNYFEIVNIIEALYTSDFLFYDIELYCQLLFEYLSFFVQIGVNPKEYVDNIIEKRENVHKK